MISFTVAFCDENHSFREIVLNSLYSIIVPIYAKKLKKHARSSAFGSKCTVGNAFESSPLNH